MPIAKRFLPPVLILLLSACANGMANGSVADPEAADAAPSDGDDGGLHDGIAAPELASVLRSRGYRADVETDNAGDPMIVSSSQGVEYRIYFYECGDESPVRCGSLLFYAGFVEDGVSLVEINEWNRTKRFGTAYLDDENHPILEMSVSANGGVTRANLAEWLEWWDAVLGEYLGHIGW